MALIIELVLIGVGLAMDAFAVSVCKGLSMRKVKARHAVVIALFFGGFQALMPVVGWALGIGFEKYITSFDHWIAFILLLIIGGKMVMDVIRGEQGPEDDRNLPFAPDIKELFLLAIATSIDALAVGVTFAFLNYSILLSASIIGVVTFVISFAGVYIGNVFGSRWEKGASLFGGIILILIGTKILLEHLGVISF